MSKTLKLINVTCKECTKPLFAIHILKKGSKLESYGAGLRMLPARLGVKQRGIAVCRECGAETEFDASSTAFRHDGK